MNDGYSRARGGERPITFPMDLVEGLASLRLTLFSLLTSAGAVLWFYNEMPAGTPVLVTGFALVLVNLLAAVIIRPVFRRQPALTLFHLTLALMLVLAALGRLMYLQGHVEVTQGQVFDPAQVEYRAGPLHRMRLQDVVFVNEGYRIEYAPGVRRGGTRNRVRWPAGDQQWEAAVIGDNHPLVQAGYRFYTSFNKGFAPTFSWRSVGQEEEVVGAVHLPSYPLREFEQAQQWQVPGGELTLWTQMVPEEEILRPEADFALGASPRHHIVVRTATRRFEMRPGERLQLPEGELVYLGLRTWMGYTINSDWTRSWLVASALVALLSMACYYWRRFFARPWTEVGNRTVASEPVE